MGKTVSGVLGARLGEVLAPIAGAPAVEAPAPDAPAAAQEPQTPAPQPDLPQTGSSAGAPPADEEPPVIDTAAPDADAAPVDGPRAPDPLLAAAVELAREAAREVGGTSVGDHLEATADGPADGGPVVTHAFATTDPAYVGWRWAVTVARAEDGDDVTVDEVVLLPGEGALLAPAWVPWSERVQAGDVGPGDLLPPPTDDVRLVPSYAAPDGDDAALADAAFFELGLGRPRVLSLEGRLDAAQRWWDGDAGPDSPIARQAPGRCVDCGFLVALAGGLRQAFGVCANGVAPDDGRVVALSHGCGAHSETVVDAPHASTAGMAVEDDEFELLPGQP